ncbi:MAG TPA: 2-phospho-L-lactate guanylyltransferase, partial [Roseiflexaceae bacterium]|nr:2-phospho-L-lactate guanylyltransferase [Roseiflexaceae bacterium]
MLHALVPVKSLALAKTRLAALLSADERRSLALAMLADVLEVLIAAPVVERVVVVSRDEAVLALARSTGVCSYTENAPDLNSALRRAALWSRQQGAPALAALHADLPLLTAGDVEALALPLTEGYDASLAPAQDGGTNAVAFRSSADLPFLFGGRSLARFERVAEARQLSARLVRSYGLEHDIDRPEDLVWLVDQPGTTRA